MGQDMLKTSMQKEIHIMRELLANMLQEELSLQLDDDMHLSSLLSQRATLTQTLNSMQAERIELEKTCSKNITDSCEILSLVDQILALQEKMQDQNRRNTLLSLRKKHLTPIKTTQKPSVRRVRLQVMPKPKIH